MVWRRVRLQENRVGLDDCPWYWREFRFTQDLVLGNSQPSPTGLFSVSLIYPGLPRISCTLLQAGLRMRLSKPHEAPRFHQAAQETRVRPGLHSAVPFGTVPIHPDR
jgi:hypothetical protein